MLSVVFGKEMIESTPENVTSETTAYLEHRLYKTYDNTHSGFYAMQYQIENLNNK